MYPSSSSPQHTWHDGFLAGGALGGVIIGVAFSAEQQVIFCGKGLFHQRAAALPALETQLVPVTILVGQVLEIFNKIFIPLVDIL